MLLNIMRLVQPQKTGYYSSSDQVDRIVSTGTCPVYSPVIACSPIEWRVEVVYPLADIILSGIHHASLYNSASSFFECQGFGPGLGMSSMSFASDSFKVEILTQIEDSDRCSDVQKLFSIKRNDGHILYKKS